MAITAKTFPPSPADDDGIRGDDDGDLLRIADSFLHELTERYPKLAFGRLKLQAPGYAVCCTRHGGLIEDHLFMVKVIRNGVLFDTQNKPNLPDFRENVQEGMLLRLLEIDYADPRMLDLVFEQADKFAAVAQG